MNGNQPTDDSGVPFSDEQPPYPGPDEIDATAFVDTKSVVDGYVSAEGFELEGVKLRFHGEDHGQLNGLIILTPSRAKDLAADLIQAANTAEGGE
jgi:hypothetical protein